MTTLGVLGGGQLGRMLALDAKCHGIRVVVRTDEAPGGPAEQVADAAYLGAYGDDDMNRAFARECDAITSEFENLPPTLLQRLAEYAPVRPGADSLAICQNRRREKEFLAEHGIPHAPFSIVTTMAELGPALDRFGNDAILKTAAFGYDGKGQTRFRPGSGNLVNHDDPNHDDPVQVDLIDQECVLESVVPFVRELSVVGVRTLDGTWCPFPVGENVHVHGILDHTIAPARVGRSVSDRAQELAGRIAGDLGHVGTIGVEFFLLADDTLVVNEMAPRPHNSGHHTIEACVTSQFGQQWRAALGQAPGDPTQHTPAVMLNLLGDLWADGEPDWSQLGASAHLHLYGKAEARAGRKMGHITVLGDDVGFALEQRRRCVGGSGE